MKCVDPIPDPTHNLLHQDIEKKSNTLNPNGGHVLRGPRGRPVVEMKNGMLLTGLGRVNQETNES